jgi:phage shock protein PspC (stress-responsive transcriptional regulator)
LCGGLAEQWNVDSNLLRLVVVVTTFFSGGTVIPIYVIASIVIPKETAANIPPMYPPYGGGAHGMNGNMYAGAGHTGAYQPQQGCYPGSGAAPSGAVPNPKPSENSIDEMMKDVEKKALWKEIEELRAKVAKYEKGE